MNELLIEGDVFKLEKGMNVYVEVEERFVYSNRPLSRDIAEERIVVGSILKNKCLDVELQYCVDRITREASELLCDDRLTDRLKSAVTLEAEKKFDKLTKTFDASIFIGNYVVIKHHVGGGGSGHGANDRYPDGHCVRAVKLKDGKWDGNGLNVRFYQSGSFTAMIKPEQITKIGTMKMQMV